jgi:hypothetical protein
VTPHDRCTDRTPTRPSGAQTYFFFGGFVVGVGFAVVVVVGFAVVVVVGLVVVVVVGLVVVDVVVVVGRAAVVVVVGGGVVVVVVGCDVVAVVGAELPLGDDTVNTAAPGRRLSRATVVEVGAPAICTGAWATGFRVVPAPVGATLVDVAGGSATPAMFAIIGAAGTGAGTVVAAERGSSTIGAIASALLLPPPGAVVDGDSARFAGSAGGDFDDETAISPPSAPPARRSARGVFCMDEG